MRRDTEGPLSILVICDDHRSHAETLRQHLAGFREYSRHNVRLYNARGVPRSKFLDLEAFDVVVIHYSLVITSDNYLAPWLRQKIQAFEGLKVQLLQDEYRWVDDVTAMMRWLGIDILFSIVPAAAIPAVYDGRIPGVDIVPTLAGFVPEGIARIKRLPRPSERSVDVGYRGRVLPYWIGSLSQEKIAIAQGFLARSATYGLRCDIAWSEADRLYGEKWKRFLLSCRTTLGTESGSSLTDFDGSVERETLSYLAESPGAAFEEVFRNVLAPYEGNVMMNVISPRVFEAAAFRTALVMFPGDYGGVVEPGRHYIQLEKDFSNMDDVVAAIRDDRLLEQLTQRTHDDLIASGRYSLRAFVAEFDRVVDARAKPMAKRPMRSFSAARVERPVVTRSVFGVDIMESNRARQRYAVALRLIAEQPPLRVLATAFVRDSELRRRFGKRRALEDFLRLGLLRREQASRSIAAEPFFVVPTFEEPGALTLESRARADTPVGKVDSSEALARLREGRPTILWNHSAVGALVTLLRPGRNPLGLQVGYYRTLGVYDFGLLRALTKRHRDLVIAALTPLLQPASEEAEPPLVAIASRPPGSPRERKLTPSGSPSRAERLISLGFRGRVSAFMLRARLAHVVFRAVAGRRGRLAMRYYVRAQRSGRVSLSSLLIDLVKLRALAFVAQREPMGVAVEDGCVTYVTNGDARDTPDSGAVRRIAWDHSAVGSTVDFGGLSLTIGSTGVYEFPALERLLRHAREATWQALLPEYPQVAPPPRTTEREQFK